MGPLASSNGPYLNQIVADFNVPDIEPESELHLEVNPDMAIPDNSSGGVFSVINQSSAGNIREISVAIDIDHSYIGDLRVVLVAPNGQTVTLHSRSGASNRNLIANYSSLDNSDLVGLLGTQAQGDWTLQVSDHAPRDTGILRRWSLTLALEEVDTPDIQVSASPGITIPDNDATGIRSEILVAQEGRVQKIRVNTDITHTYIGDLIVTLHTLDEKQVTLHNATGGGEDNLIMSFDPQSAPELSSIIGQSVRGTWTLKVTDTIGQDVGKLNEWGLELMV